ncbi:DUF5681 domain-containing protein [Azospirillum doebereinerae]
MSETEDYPVGYGKPPEHSRFRKGRSGNPRGRPKGARNLKTDLLEMMQETMVLRENGRAVTMTRQRALLLSLMSRGLTKDTRAAVKLLDMCQSLLAGDETEEAREAPPSAEEREVLDSLTSRVLKREQRRARRDEETGT